MYPKCFFVCTLTVSVSKRHEFEVVSTNAITIVASTLRFLKVGPLSKHLVLVLLDSCVQAPVALKYMSASLPCEKFRGVVAVGLLKIHGFLI